MPIHHYSDVLIVDDSGTVRSLVRKILAQLGYKSIHEASDGEGALEKILEKHFDLVISDWNMEPMNGEELLKEVRANKKCAQLPFIMMTSDCAIKKVVLARRAGADFLSTSRLLPRDFKPRFVRSIARDSGTQFPRSDLVQ